MRSLTSWLAACGVALWVLIAALAAEIDISPIAGGGSAGPSAGEAAAPAVLAGLEDFGETLRRPVFSKSRRPFVPPPEPEPEAMPESEPPPPEAEAAVEAPPPEGLALRGVAITREKRSALLVTAGNPNGQWIAVGGTIESWQVAEVAAGYTVLRSGQQVHTLHLYVDNRKVE